jgi:hypothetical protein
MVASVVDGTRKNSCGAISCRTHSRRNSRRVWRSRGASLNRTQARAWPAATGAAFGGRTNGSSHPSATSGSNNSGSGTGVTFGPNASATGSTRSAANVDPPAGRHPNTMVRPSKYHGDQLSGSRYNCRAVRLARRCISPGSPGAPWSATNSAPAFFSTSAASAGFGCSSFTSISPSAFRTVR